MTFRFVVDERSINLNGLESSAGKKLIQDMLYLIYDVQEEGHVVCFDDDLFTMSVLHDRSFWELCDPESPVRLDAELSQFASAIFGRMPRWYETETPGPADFDVSIDGRSKETSASVAWAHRQAIVGGLSSAACLSAFGGRRTGVVEVVVAGQLEEVWFADTRRGIEQYFRWIIAKHASTPDQIANVAPFAFTQIRFVDRCFDGIGKMSKPCRQLAPAIVAHLAAFSDEGKRIFSGPWARAPLEFAALGVQISDENGNTKSNAIARRERSIILDGETQLFWWHSKIEPHQDRIHICPNLVPNGGAVVVGIFCRHLTV